MEYKFLRDGIKAGTIASLLEMYEHRLLSWKQSLKKKNPQKNEWKLHEYKIFQDDTG